MMPEPNTSVLPWLMLSPPGQHPRAILVCCPAVADAKPWPTLYNLWQAIQTPQAYVIFMCRLGRIILERLIDALNHGPESQSAWALLILQALFEAPGFNLGQGCQLLADPQLTYPVAALLETRRGHHALQVCLQECMQAQSTPSCNA